MILRLVQGVRDIRLPHSPGVPHSDSGMQVILLLFGFLQYLSDITKSCEPRVTHSEDGTEVILVYWQGVSDIRVPHDSRITPGKCGM